MGLPKGVVNKLFRVYFFLVPDYIFVNEVGLIVTNGYHTHFWICHSFLDKYIYNICIYTYKNHIIWNKLASIYIINGYMRDGLSISTPSPVLRRSPNKTKKTF